MLKKIKFIVFGIIALLTTSCSYPLFFKLDKSYIYHTLSEFSPSYFDNDPDGWFDSDGIYNYWYRDYGYIKNPVTMSQYALVAMNEYIFTKNSKYLDILIRYADALLLMGSYIQKDLLAFRYEFPYFPYGLSSPRTSAMAQGQAASVFIRAYIISGKSKYQYAAEKSLLYMLNREAIGGMRPLNVLTPEGNPWLEEYPSLPSSLVLNGFIFALIGLVEYNYYIGNSDSLKNWEVELLDSLRYSIPYYEVDNWVVYDRRSYDPAADVYPEIHCFLMEHLYFLTNDKTFYATQRRWNQWLIDVNWKPIVKN